MNAIIGWCAFGALVAGLLIGSAPAAFAQVRETAALVTEIRLGKGKAEARPAGGEWRAAGPLQALRAGDEVRVSDDASLVVVLSGGRGTVKLAAKSSPWTVPAAPVDGKAQKAQSLITSSFGFLGSSAKESPKAVLSVRAGGAAPAILTPRNGPMLSDALVFEWIGNDVTRYTVQVSGPTGPLLERRLTGGRFVYPADAPELKAGVRYMFHVEAVGQSPQVALFEVLDRARTAQIRADLAEVDATLGASASATSLAVVKAGALAEAGLVHDARLIVLAALAKDPDEPTLHTVLGQLYAKSGLPRQAAQSFEEARSLLTRAR